jgi:hypothetical protein
MTQVERLKPKVRPGQKCLLEKQLNQKRAREVAQVVESLISIKVLNSNPSNTKVILKKE